MPVRRSGEQTGWELVWQARFNLLRMQYVHRTQGQLTPNDWTSRKGTKAKVCGAFYRRLRRNFPEMFCSGQCQLLPAKRIKISKCQPRIQARTSEKMIIFFDQQMSCTLTIQ